MHGQYVRNIGRQIISEEETFLWLSKVCNGCATSIRLYVLPPNRIEQRVREKRNLKIFYIPEHFQKLYGKLIQGSKITRIMDISMNTHV
jgi:hypothetical protein